MPPSANLVKWPATEMAEAVRQRRVSALELFTAHAESIEARNPTLNALVSLRLDEARQEAVAADAALAHGRAEGPMHGVPFTCKDTIAAAGLPWTAGSLLHRDRVPNADAPAVSALRRAGGVLLGKTNASEFGAFYDTVNRVHGATRNPHDLDRSAGGSSGGECAAVSGGLSPGGIGSDLGGSIRHPAHFTGVCGLRPSRGVVPMHAHDPRAETPGIAAFAVIGPIARTVGDLDLLLSVLEGRGIRTAAPGLSGPISIAAYEDDGLQPVAASCRRAVRLAAEALADAGYEVVEERPPDLEEVRAVYDLILSSEFAAAMVPRLRGREGDLTDYVAEMVRWLGGVRTSLEDYLRAFARLDRLEERARDWFARRIALSPAAPAPAPRVGRGGYTSDDVDGQAFKPGGKMSLSTHANAIGLPSVAVPVMRTSGGLPVGVQLTGRRGSDREVLALAAELEAALGGWRDPDTPSG